MKKRILSNSHSLLPLLLEEKSLSFSYRYLVGIDEAGRGALAGRLAVAGVVLPSEKINLIKGGIFFEGKFLPLRDSKKLSSSQRKKWFGWIKKERIIYSTSFVSPKKIDKLNVAKACNLAAYRLLEKLLRKIKTKKKTDKILVIADGGIYFELNDLERKNSLTLLTFPKADEKVPAVALASIVAKVLRDKEMERLHLVYPEYQFCAHKGYGTKKHFQVLKKIGPSQVHRQSFLRKFFESFKVA